MRIVAILAVVLAAFQMSPLSASEMVPHEATFVSTLEEYHGPGEIQAWGGSMKYSVSRDCQKWKSVTDIVYRFTVNGTESEIWAHSTIYEALDGSRVEFDTRTEVNGQILSHKKGSAKLQGTGKPGVATYKIPQGETLNLPAGTIFPVASWLSSINYLAAGKKKWKQLIFNDGELMDYVYSVRKRGVSSPASPQGDAGLVSQAGWLIDGKVYARQSEAHVQLTLLSHSSGATSLYIQGNEMFSTREDLVEIKALPAPQC